MTLSCIFQKAAKGNQTIDLEISMNAKATCMRIDIKIVNHHRQEYPHQYAREK
jgi:hypothetical protein